MADSIFDTPMKANFKTVFTTGFISCCAAKPIRAKDESHCCYRRCKPLGSNGQGRLENLDSSSPVGYDCL